MRSVFAAIATAVLLSACASGSNIVTGQTRAPTDPAQVQVLLNMPANHEVIGLVEARSTAGWTDQDKQSAAVEELRKQAASLGANAIVLSHKGTELTSGATFVSNGAGGGSFIPYESRQKTLSAVAIVVRAAEPVAPPRDTIPPTVRFVTPTVGSVVSGVVNVTVEAQDNFKIAKLALTIDGKEVAVASGPTISYAWRTTTSTPAPTSASQAGKGKAAANSKPIPATLVAQAEDAAGNVATASIAVLRK
jgi:hypothetical protein